MSSDVSEAIDACRHRAEHCRRRAMELADPVAKREFLEMERRWLDLARSYEYSGWLSHTIDAHQAGPKLR